ncbi:MAG TPA: hypothetical protein VGW38_06260 [Chloroflexota bacterium]|nr:hypothetical protein [Chloroflexota bacterium]
MPKLLISVTMIMALLAPLTALATTGNMTDADVQQQLAAVRQATAKYHDVDRALADGYSPVSPCEELPGVGAMGIHYLNPKLASDLTVDPFTPEVLLYVPSGNRLRLVGVEYFAANVGQPHPSLFGRAFDGPMAGHSPGMPEHYDLHVWIWQANPNGVFAVWNPTVRCGG